MLFKSRAVALDVVPELHETLAVEDVVAALDAVESGGDLAVLDDLPAVVGDALRHMARERAAREEKRLCQTVGSSIQASEAMAATARITGEIRETDARAQGMAAGIEEMTASIDQIASTAREVAGSMESAQAAMQSGADATRSAAEASRDIGRSFSRMTGSAEQLAEAAEQIGTFVATIDGLAQQTNLLALNATIEAARAGAAGKGFAVVASEVKVLSGQTQKATDDIRARIERLEAHVEEVMANVREVQALGSQSIERSEDAEGQISEVLSIVESNNARMGEIASVLEQQSTAVQEISDGAHRIAQHSQAAAGYADAVIVSVSKSEETITQQLDDLEKRNVPNYVLHRAKSDHLLWKKRLAEMLVGLKSLTSDELSDHHQCRLGKWYDTVSDQSIRNHPAFADILPVHEEVHRLGREAARLFAQGDRTGAHNAMLDMDRASADVLRYLDQLLNAEAA